MSGEVCSEHSGCQVALTNLKANDSKLWDEIEKGRGRMDNIFTKLNTILGGIVVAIVMLLINILLRI